jgi:hypothetical protein
MTSLNAPRPIRAQRPLGKKARPGYYTGLPTTLPQKEKGGTSKETAEE